MSNRTSNRVIRRILRMPFKFSNRQAMNGWPETVQRPGNEWCSKKKRSASQNRWKNHSIRNDREVSV